MVRVFIVEDDEDITRLYKRILDFNGYQIIGAAENGLVAIEMFKEFLQKPDIVIMDYQMPFLNGIDTMKELLAIDNTTKIIFISSDSSIKGKALSMGAIRFENKPISICRLDNSIRKVLA